MTRTLCLLCLLFASVATPAAQRADVEALYRFTLAKTLAEEGNYAEALRYYSEAVELAPQDIYIRIELAELLLGLGRLEEAVAQSEAVLELAPRDLDALRLTAQVHMRLAERGEGSVDSARRALEAVREVAPDDIESMVTLGQIYLSESRHGDAARVFEEALARRPGNRLLYSLLVDALVRSGDSPAAEAALGEALERDAEFLRGRLILAELQSERGDHGAAVSTLESVPESEARDLELRKRLALELHHTGSFERAIEVLDGVLAEEPNYFGGRYLRALIMTAQGRDDEAAALLFDLVAERPESADLAFLLARIRERQGRPDEAIAVLERLASRHERDGAPELARQARLQQMLVRARQERWSEVVEQLAPRLESAGPEDIEVVLLYAEALARLDRGDEAIAALRRFSEGTAAASRTTAKEVELLFELGREREARRRLQQLAASGQPEDLMLVAEIYQQRESFAEAIPILERVVKQQPEFLQALFWLGASYERVGRRDQAERTFESLLELDPDFAPALNYLGYMWADLGQNLERALELVQQAVALEPDNGAYVDSLGWAHFRLGQYDEARSHLERAASLVGDDPIVYEHLGDLYQALGRLADARASYQRALGLKGDNANQVREKLEVLGAPN